MKNCLNCENYIPKNNIWKCESMTAPMDNYKCHVTKEQKEQAEEDIIDYTLRRESNDKKRAKSDILPE